MRYYQETNYSSKLNIIYKVIKKLEKSVLQ